MIVSVCVVAYNEEKVLGNLLNDIKAQDYEHSKIEVVLIDSMSTDHTKDIMRDFQQQTSDDFKKIQVLENLKKKQASGWNVAIRNFSGDVMIRVDAHASIPPEFVRKNVEILESGEMVSGGPRPNMRVHRGKKPCFWQNSLCLEAVWLLIGEVRKNNMSNLCFMAHIVEKYWRK